MREPSFWWRPPGLAAAVLAPAAWLYGAIAAQRMRRPGAAAGIPVICVGNLTVGGAGKTPTAMAVAELLIAEGHRPVFLSRGYGGRLAGPVRVDPATHGAADVGDEPLLLARVAPTIVARDRVAGASAARAADADIVVMDDGFQNPALAKDLSIVVVDGPRGTGNGSVCPAGPLRAPVEAQLDYAHAILVVGKPVDAWPVLARAFARKLPVFHGRLEPDARVLETLRSGPVLAFAGIGDPEKFFTTLSDARIEVRARQAFPDHHRYQRADAEGIVARAARENLVPVTTEKDQVRLAGQAEVAELARIVRALPVKLVMAEAEAFRQLVLDRAGPR
jgi:tetraacyldisaccharide 4'-kinase